MEREDIILASEFCVHHNIELSFIQTLSDSGMIATESVEDHVYLPVSELKLVEKIVHLHFELDINLEGVETIMHMLGRIEDMQSQITQLKNRLRHYEQ